jgi:hypothetical protein
LPQQLLSRSSYAWFCPSFHWKLLIHPAARFLAAPDTETRFPCLQTRSGAQNTGDRAQARRKAPEVPEQAVVLATVMCSREDGGDLGYCLVGGGDYRCLVRGRDMDCAKAARRGPRGTCFTAEPAKLKRNDKTAID